MSALLDIGLLLLGSLYGYYLVRHIRRNQFDLPPGPKKYPIIGSLLSIPIVYQHEAFARLSKEHDSDIIYFDAAGTHIVILNSLESATELLENRSTNYSDRPYLTMLSDLIGGQEFLSLKNYGPQWKEERKLLVRHLVSQQNTDWNRRWLMKFSQHLILDIVETPTCFMNHLESGIGESLIKFIYGIQLHRPDPLVRVAHETMKIVTVAALPGKFLVDQLPWLRHVPEWFPGAEFQTFARIGKDTLTRHFEKPFEIAMRAITDGTSRPSFVSTYFETKDYKEGAYPERELKTVRNTAGVIFAGAADTTNAFLSSIILAMLVHPDVQGKVHAEIDKLVESGHIPMWSEQSLAPYFHAVMKEVLRWQPIAPTGIPHLATRADIFNGYYIPEGSVVFANAWAILNDSEVFPEPRKFNPERFEISEKWKIKE